MQRANFAGDSVIDPGLCPCKGVASPDLVHIAAPCLTSFKVIGSDNGELSVAAGRFPLSWLRLGEAAGRTVAATLGSMLGRAQAD